MRVRVAVAVALAAALLASCSDGDRSAAPPATTAAPGATTAGASTATSAPPVSTTAAPTTAAAAADRCSSSTLALASREGLGALGHALYVLQLRNTAGQACRLTGYPAVSLVAGDGRLLAQAQPGAGYILPDRPPAAVSLAAGGSAYFGVESYNVCNGGVEPSVAQTVRVTPPDATTALTVSAQMNVCPGQPVRVSPVRPTERDIAP
ncbi:MAG: DUF4232 domain-containing protein [Acidimicrobiales bacterium]